MVAWSVVIYVLSPLTSGYDLFSVQTEKVCVALYGVSLYFVLRGVEVARRRVKVRMRMTVLDWLVAGYFCYWTVRVLEDWEVVDRWVVLAGVLSCGIYVMVRREGRLLLRWLVWALPALLVWQWWFGVTHLGRGMTVASVAGSFLNTGIWGCFLASLVAGMWGRVCVEQRGCLRWWLLTGCFLGVVMLILAHSRAAWLGVLVGGGYAAWRAWRRFLKGVRIVLLVVAAIMGVVAVGSTYGKTDSALGRVLVWKTGVWMGQESLWGLGVDGFHRNYMRCQATYLETEGNEQERLLADENGYAFNEYLRVWVEMGLLGVVFLLLLLIVLLVGWRRLSLEVREKYAWVWAMLLVWGVFALFSYPVSNMQTRILFVVPLGLVACLLPVALEVRVRRKILLLGNCGLVGVLWGTLVFHKACVEWNKGGEIEGRLRVECLKPLRNTSFVLANAALRLNMEKRFAEAEGMAKRGRQLYHSYFAILELGKSLASQGHYREAEWMWREASWLLPNRFAPLFFRMEMWREREEWGKALGIAREMLAKPVKVRSSRLTYMLMRAQETVRL